MIENRNHLAGWLRNAAKEAESMTDEQWSRAGRAAAASLNDGKLPLMFGQQDRKNYIEHCRSAAQAIAPLPSQ